jgi:hypothetical protein
MTDMIPFMEARNVLAEGLRDLLPATAEAIDPKSGIELSETENHAVTALAKLIDEATNG